MNKLTSVYLDLVRFLAAIVVVLAHVLPVLTPNSFIPTPTHEAVVIFFVMSGYVIAYASSERERTLFQYTFNRLTRIYLVALPALLLGAVLSPYIGAQVGEAFPLPKNWYQVAGSVIANILFMGQSWFGDVPAPINSAYWSLNYEVYYYAIFAAWTFLRPGVRELICLILVIAAGPKIMALAPCWALGVLVYRFQSRFSMSKSAATAALLSSAIGLVVLFVSGLDAMVRSTLTDWWPDYYQWMGASNKAPTDFLVALCFAASIIAVGNGAWPLNFSPAIERPIRWSAKRTLSIYLFHAPVFVFLYGLLGLRGWHVAGLEIIGVLMLAQVTEVRLNQFRSITRGMLSWVSPRVLQRRHPATSTRTGKDS